MEGDDEGSRGTCMISLSQAQQGIGKLDYILPRNET